jgi:hypothetical protein
MLGGNSVMKITYNTIDKVFGAKLCSVDTMQLKGYELVEEYFVDSSGLGEENEPALTKSQLEYKLKRLLDKPEYKNGLTAKITGQGMFQVYLGLFKRTGKSRMRKVANNTYIIESENGFKIRFHDTDIFEKLPGGAYLLNSGGWNSKTTKERLSEWVHRETGARFYQKNWEWYIQDGDAEPIKFYDGILLKYRGGVLKPYSPKNTKELETLLT